MNAFSWSVSTVPIIFARIFWSHVSLVLPTCPTTDLRHFPSLAEPPFSQTNLLARAQRFFTSLSSSFYQSLFLPDVSSNSRVITSHGPSRLLLVSSDGPSYHLFAVSQLLVVILPSISGLRTKSLTAVVSNTFYEPSLSQIL